jgi:hypothetical protein
MNKNITIEDILKYPQIEWNYNMISNCNKNLTFDVALDCEEIGLWTSISGNENITIDIIEEYPDFEWDYSYLSSNKRIPIQYVLNNITKPWNLYNVMSFLNISIKDIENNPDFDWDYDLLSDNDHIKFTDIINNENMRNKPWNYDKLSANMSMNEIDKYKYLFTFKIIYSINKNTFDKDREEFVTNSYKEHLAAFRIQNRWRNARVNPNTKLCKKRLEREMDELGLVSEAL